MEEFSEADARAQLETNFFGARDTPDPHPGWCIYAGWRRCNPQKYTNPMFEWERCLSPTVKKTSNVYK